MLIKRLERNSKNNYCVRVGWWVTFFLQFFSMKYAYFSFKNHCSHSLNAVFSKHSQSLIHLWTQDILGIRKRKSVVPCLLRTHSWCSTCTHILVYSYQHLHFPVLNFHIWQDKVQKPRSPWFPSWTCILTGKQPSHLRSPDQQCQITRELLQNEASQDPIPDLLN